MEGEAETGNFSGSFRCEPRRFSEAAIRGCRKNCFPLPPPNPAIAEPQKGTLHTQVDTLAPPPAPRKSVAVPGPETRLPTGALLVRCRKTAPTHTQAMATPKKRHREAICPPLESPCQNRQPSHRLRSGSKNR